MWRKYFSIMAALPLTLSGVLVTSDNQKIAYEHYLNGHQKLVIIVHGFYNSKQAVLLQNLKDELLTTYDVFMFDLRGHGKSGGFFTWTSHEDKDLIAVLDYLKGKYKRIGIIAFSLGASICLNVLSKEKRADALICVSAPSEFKKIDYQFWKLNPKDDLFYTLISSDGRKGKGVRTGPFWLKKQNPIQNVGNLEVPVLYIHGQKDWVIKPWHSQLLYDRTKTKKKLVLIKEGPHAEYLLKEHAKEMINIINDWFKENLKLEDR
ncbi:MAG: alpha/beta hydrolase [Candidatus Omnitrophica bacterium]|nr:alpha/beta hydrolase [Candidatus Omnitrophota bacterium]